MSNFSDDHFIALDTETTGLNAAEHAIIEIGCVHWSHQGPLDKTFHQYLNPGRAIDEGATRIHGITLEQLKGKPSFYEVADALLAEIEGRNIVIHNAAFDVGFINSELRRCQHKIRDIRKHANIIDSWTLAKEKHPGQRNNLDALCKRYQINNASRTLHGALLDAHLLAQVYAAMRQEQTELIDSKKNSRTAQNKASETNRKPATLETRPATILATPEEQTAHQAFLDTIRKQAKQCLWDQHEQNSSTT